MDDSSTPQRSVPTVLRTEAVTYAVMSECGYSPCNDDDEMSSDEMGKAPTWQRQPTEKNELYLPALRAGEANAISMSTSGRRHPLFSRFMDQSGVPNVPPDVLLEFPNMHLSLKQAMEKMEKRAELLLLRTYTESKCGMKRRPHYTDANLWPVSPLAEGKAPSFKVPPTWQRPIRHWKKGTDLRRMVLKSAYERAKKMGWFYNLAATNYGKKVSLYFNNNFHCFTSVYILLGLICTISSFMLYYLYS